MIEKIRVYIQANPRRVAALAGTTVLFIIFMFWLIHYLSTGAVIITTNDKTNNLQLQRINNGSGGVYKATGKLRVRVPAGQYVARVGNRVSTSKHIITVKARQTSRYTINVEPPVYPEPILSFGALSVAANTSSMFYINPDNRQLYSIGPDGKTASLGAIAFSSIKWINTGYGVGVDSTNNNLFSIKDGIINPINLPFVHSKLYYDLPPDGKLVVSDGKSIFKQNPDGSVGKFFTVDADSVVSSIKASNNNVLVRLDSKGGGDADEARSVMVNMRGTKVATDDKLSVYSYIWSPDGQKLAVTNDSGTYIYDTNLQLFKELPDVNVISLTWLDSDTLLYGAGDSLYSYDIKDDTSRQLATMTGGAGISGIYPSDDKSQIYILAEKHEGSQNATYSTVRVTPGKSVPDYLQGLSIFLPASVGVCSFNYNNFARPTITVTYPNLEVDPNRCLQAAKGELRYYEVNPDAFQYIVTPKTINESYASSV